MPLLPTRRKRSRTTKKSKGSKKGGSADADMERIRTLRTANGELFNTFAGE